MASTLPNVPLGSQAGKLRSLERGIKTNKSHRWWELWLGMLLSGVAGTAQATLVGILPTTPGGTDYQAYYDTKSNLTWLANANDAVGSSYDTISPGSGLLNWTDANAWAAGLSITGYAGSSQIDVTGWTLPTTTQPDPTCSQQETGVSVFPLLPYPVFPDQGWGLDCTGSEMGNLFYNVLGGTARDSITISHNSNYDLFSNLQPLNYWSATADAPSPISAWSFGFFNGSQDYAAYKSDGLYAWAVHAGDVAATVPEPSTLLLMATGLAGLATRQRLTFQ